MAINKLLKSKFRGCILGSLIGDCYGAPFKGDALGGGSKLILQKYFDKLDGPYFAAPAKKYTEHTCMVKCVSQYLIDNKSDIEPVSFAKSLVKEYLIDPKRGYGANVANIFHQMRLSNFEEPFEAAQTNKNRGESNDNGAAMRVAPFALNFREDYDKMLDVVKTTSELTHSHPDGIKGAVLQCIAVQQSLLWDPEKKLDVFEFTDKLIEKMSKLEKDDEGLGIGDRFQFKRRLQVIKEFLDKKSVEDEEIVATLGQNSLAVCSIPTAIYCFLTSQRELENIKTDNPFRRTVQYAISLGGETDTIAAMAGSLAGAYYGEKIINEPLMKHCEDNQGFVQLADKLYELKK